ncbi:MAG: hypothetical protein LC799_28940, partial [Actinobacteria bacterium]|nr:hypothetical protein [Actinomycetota bacterium]
MPPGSCRCPSGPPGEVLNERAKSKVCRQHRGHEAIERRLIHLEASAPRAGQSPADWLAWALDDVGASVIRHGGNYQNAGAIGNRAPRR